MSHSQFHRMKFILRHAWLNLWDKHMTTGRINQVACVGRSRSQRHLSRATMAPKSRWSIDKGYCKHVFCYSTSTSRHSLAVITICVSILCISYITIDTDQFRNVSLFMFLHILATTSVEFNSTIWWWSSRPIGGQSLRIGVASAISDIRQISSQIPLIALCNLD